MLIYAPRDVAQPTPSVAEPAVLAGNTLDHEPGFLRHVEHSGSTGPRSLLDSRGIPMPGTTAPVTYLIVDGENIDATLGNSVLERRPAPAERPRWERLRDFARDTWQQPVKALFFLNASGGGLPMPFVRALLSMDYRPIPLAGSSDQKVVDIGIQRTLEAIARRPGNVMLASHDGDFLPQVDELLRGDHQVAVVGFKEFLNAGFADLPGLHVFDIEEDAGCFTNVLPRVRIIDLESFDPERFL